jgi:hypothetical protein
LISGHKLKGRENLKFIDCSRLQHIRVWPQIIIEIMMTIYVHHACASERNLFVMTNCYGILVRFRTAINCVSSENIDGDLIDSDF